LAEIDDWFDNLFADDKPKETPTETVKEIPVKETLDEETWARVETQAEPEPVNAEPEVISAVDAAKKELEAAIEVENAKKAAMQAAKEQMLEMQKLWEQAKRFFDSAAQEYNQAVYGKHDAERKVTEEEHRKAEAEKEALVQAQRKEKFALFKREIDELNPAWRGRAFEHQWEGATTLALHGSALLADGMGLGKTLTSIMYLDFVKAQRVLVVTPNDTCENYTLELMEWAPHRFTFTLGESTKTQREILMRTVFKRRRDEGKDFVMTVNFEQLYNWDFVQQLRELGFDTIIIDEAHSFKNKRGLLFKALEYLKYSEGTTVERILPMTGTFILNKPQDIWPALYLLDRDQFYSENQFLQNYCHQSYDYKWSFRTGGVTSLIKRLGGRIVQRTKEEAGIVLPAMHIHDETSVHRDSCEECALQFPLAFVDNYNDQRRVMKQLAEHSQIILDAQRKSDPINQLALITRNRQAIVWPAGITVSGTLANGEPYSFSVGDEVQESIKVDWVEWKIRRLREQGKRVVVFSQFKSGIAELEQRLFNERVVRYDGDTPMNIKSEVKHDFDRKRLEIVDEDGNVIDKKPTKWDVVLCNFKTGGVGLNFTDATDIILLDEEWNPGKNEQAFARCWRIGQREEVNIWIPRVKRTIDMWMKGLNDEKRSLIDGFNLEVDLSKDFGGFLDEMRGML
jgi:chromodomain-helicase-DNA-binding protein 7